MRISRVAVLWLLLIPLFAVAALNVLYLWKQTTNPGDTNNPESLAVYWIQKVSQGQGLYSDFHNPPYNLTSYGPIYYFSMAGITKWFHLTSDAVFVWGRRFIFLCTMLIAVLIFANARKANRNLLVASLASGLFLSSYVLFPIAVTCRPDMLAAFFTIVGLFLYLHNPDRFPLVPIALFVCAYFSKQSYISGPVAVVLFEAMRSTKRAAVIAGIYAACVGGILLGMHIATNGLSTENLIVSNMGPMKFFNARIVTNAFLQMSPLALILGVSAVWAQFIIPGRDESRPTAHGLPIYFLISCAVALITSAKTGSAVNYFVEPVIAASLLLPSLFERVFVESEDRLVFAMLVATFWVLLIPQFNFLLHSVQTLKFSNETEIRSLVKQADGRVLSDSPRLAFLAKDPIFLDSLNLSFMELQGRWNSKGLTDMMKRHEIQYVVFTLPVEESSTWQRFHRFPQKVLDTIRADYRFWQRIDNYYVYVPK